MLIDWMSLKLTRDECSDWSGWSVLADWGDRIQRVCPRTGDVRWSTDAWDSVRSDSHQVVIQASESHFYLQGSPARVMGVGDTVFGFGSAGRDPRMCARSMIDFAAKHLRVVDVPSLEFWNCSRFDVTKNFILGSLADVRIALAELRSVEGGRYRVSQQAGDTVYWSHLSRLRSGKAYAKGPHLDYLNAKKTYLGCSYEQSDHLLANRLLRLELKLGSEFMRRLRSDSNVRWYDLTWEFLSKEHDSFFGRMLGDIEVLDMSMLDRLIQVAPTEGRAKAAFRTWGLIQSIGWQSTKESMPKPTWYKHLQYLKAAGLGDADISTGRIVSLRRRIVLNPVSSWEELRNAA